MSQASTGAITVPTHSSLRLISACTIGNALEFYDFVIFSFFARTIGQLFFPGGDQTAQLLLTFAVLITICRSRNILVNR